MSSIGFPVSNWITILADQVLPTVYISGPWALFGGPSKVWLLGAERSLDTFKENTVSEITIACTDTWATMSEVSSLLAKLALAHFLTRPVQSTTNKPFLTGEGDSRSSLGLWFLLTSWGFSPQSLVFLLFFFSYLTRKMGELRPCVRQNVRFFNITGAWLCPGSPPTPDSHQ